MRNSIFISIIILCIFGGFFQSNAEVNTGLKVEIADGVNNGMETDVAIASLGDDEAIMSGCPGKFEICEWFPDQGIDCGVTSDDEICIKIIHDGSSPLPFEIHLMQPPDDYNEPYQTFEIDTDIVIDVHDMPFNQAIIEAGSYNYDPSIGTYGGFTIPVISN